GELRGTTRRENALDLMMALRRPEEGLASGNARFEIHFEKTRRHHPGRGGSPLMPVLAELQTDDGGRGRWRWGPAAGSRLDLAAVNAAEIAVVRLAAQRRIDAREALYFSRMLEHRRRAIGDRTLEELMRQLDNEDEQGEEP